MAVWRNRTLTFDNACPEIMLTSFSSVVKLTGELVNHFLAEPFKTLKNGCPE